MRRVFQTLICTLVLVGCTKVPITGRRQMKLLPKSTLNEMSFSNYREFLNTNPVSNNANQKEMLDRVGNKLKSAIETYFASKGNSKYLEGYEWEFNLVESPDINAWCMPGGKVVVYTGIMPVVQNDAGLAVVLGHEIAHAIANHGNERMSQGLLTQMGGTALNVALANKPEETRNLFLGAYGVGTQLGAILPYSRLHESEADHMGLIFMSIAGYDPNEAVAFWTRMSQSGGQKPPQFLSTHPSDETRIKQIKDWLPEAMGYFNQYK